MKCVILHTVCNFMHTLCNSTQIYAVLSRGLFCRKLTHFSGLKMCGCKKMTNTRYGSTPNVLRSTSKSFITEETNGWMFESTFDRKPLHVLFQVYPNRCSQVSNTQIQRVQIQNYTNTGYGIPKLFAEYIQYHV